MHIVFPICYLLLCRSFEDASVKGKQYAVSTMGIS